MRQRRSSEDASVESEKGGSMAKRGLWRSNQTLCEINHPKTVNNLFLGFKKPKDCKQNVKQIFLGMTTDENLCFPCGCATGVL